MTEKPHIKPHKGEWRAEYCGWSCVGRTPELAYTRLMNKYKSRRWHKEKYNEYMKNYMRKKRAGLQEV